MSFLGSFGKELLSFGGSLLGGAANGMVSNALSAQRLEKEYELQYKNWEKMQSNKHQLEVKDLEAAGLNKILSATNGSAVSAPSLSSSNPDMSSALQASMAKGQLEVAKSEAQTNRINAITEQENAKTEATKAKTDRLVALSEIGKNHATIPLMKAQTGKTTAETLEVFQNIENSVRYLNGQLEFMRSGTAMNYAQSQKFVEEAKLAIKEAESIGLDIRLKEADLNGWPRKLESMTAEQQYKFLTEELGFSELTGIGEDQPTLGQRLLQFSYGAGLLFGSSGSGVSVPVGRSGVRYGRHN